MNKRLLILLPLLFGYGFCFAADTVDINVASLEQLDTLVGIGPAYAQKIIEARPFSSVDDLIRVKGIGEKTLQKIKDQGLACVNCAQPAQIEPQVAYETEPSSTEPETSVTQTEPEAPTQNENTTFIQPQSSQNSLVESSNEQNPSSIPSQYNEPITYPQGIILNEILPSPQGLDDEEEFFELQNINNFEVNLSGWQVKDSIGTATTFTIEEGTKISAYGFLAFKRPKTKITFNNDSDSLTLFTPDNKSVDSVSFAKAPIGQSYNKTLSDWIWSTTITPGAMNVITQPVASKIIKKDSSNSPAKNPTAKDTVLTDLSDKSLASVSNSKTSHWFLLIASIIAILSSAIVFLVKKFWDKKKLTNQFNQQEE